VSDTDYQLVQLLLSSAPVTAHHANGFIHLLGRISVGFGSYVRAGFGSDGTYFVDYWNGSFFTTMDHGTCAVPGKAALLSLYCGSRDLALPRHFKLNINASTISEFNEIGFGSPLGASNRKWGWGGSGQDNILAFGEPPKVNQWLAYDQ
jgi:hypothetical protein